MQTSENIFITGFMAVGKSSTAQQLAHDLGWNYVDLDSVVEKLNKSSIVELTERYGLSTIRKLEAEALRAITEGNNQVIALGAGCLLSIENEEIVRRSGILVYLRARIRTLAQRMVADDSKERPLLGALVDEHRKSAQDQIAEAKLTERIKELLEQRTPTYEKAEIQIQTEDKDVREVAREIESDLSLRTLKNSA